MFNTLYFLSYNNYYNRQIKYSDSLGIYLENLVLTVPNTNFNPGDEIDTVVEHMPFESYTNPDYLIVADGTDNIVSRWFVMDKNRERNGMWTITLKRDVVADYWNIIQDAPIFIEKATVLDSDPAIFNQEDMTFNQIKTSETLLKDQTGLSWIVMYLAHNQGLSAEVNVTPPGSADITGFTRENWTYQSGQKVASTNGLFSSLSLNMQLSQRTGSGVTDKKNYNINPVLYRRGVSGEISYGVNTESTTYYVTSPKGYNSNIKYTGNDFYEENKNTFNAVMNKIPVWAGLNLNDAEASAMNSLNGKTILFDGESTIYRIQIKSATKNIKVGNNSNPIASTNITWMDLHNQWPNWIPTGSSYAWNGTWFEYSITYLEYELSLVAVGASAEQITYPAMATRTILKDAPYDMICFPYETTQIKLTASQTITQYTEDVMIVVNSIIENNAGASPIVYDVQRLPYCPITTLKSVDGVLDVAAYDKKYIYTKGGNPAGIILECEVSNFQGSIDINPIVINNVKIQTLTETYRLCSPNYNGMFEFDPAMNNGLNGFNFYCSYKPFNPYIQVSPIFGGLYGGNFGDARGLICGGDFSLPIVTDAWATYERQNKNYQNIFDRQIENMRVNNKYQKTQEIASAIAGTVQGGVSGAMTGAMVGGGWGALAGGIAGTTVSAIGGIADVAINEALRKEAIDYTQDQFGYQLGNIKALPYSLAKTSAFVINNKIFPFLEYYTCTEIEKEALANKIAYNGMTVMRIGTLNEFVGNQWNYDNNIISKNYIKGKIIYNRVSEDYHLLNAIGNELNQGIFYIGEQS